MKPNAKSNRARRQANRRNQKRPGADEQKRNVRPLWSATVLRKSDRAYIELQFPVRGGGSGSITVNYSDLRHSRKLLDELLDRLPEFPSDIAESDPARLEFIKELVEAAERSIKTVPGTTGFLDRDTFATYSEIVASNGRRVPWRQLDAGSGSEIRDIRGVDQGGDAAVLQLAQQSTYLAFGLGVALAAPLPSYLKLYLDEAEEVDQALTETAVFNFSGQSSCGKSSVGRAAISLAGSPDRAGSFNFSTRGLEELAADNNDLVLVLDDSERAVDGANALVKALRSIIHTVPGGQSRIISRGVDQSKFPTLRWSTFALTSSPEPIAEIAQRCGWALSAGDKVRLFDIAVPSPKKGGIFDRMGCKRGARARLSQDRIRELEKGYRSYHGHVMPVWVEYLMKRDRRQQLTGLIDEFVEEVAQQGDGWEVRFAKKFAIVYAAMRLARKAGILPWRKSMALRVAKKCYRKARRAAKSDNERSADYLKKLELRMGQRGGMQDIAPSSSRPATISQNCVALRFEKEGRLKVGFFDDAVTKILGGPYAKRVLIDRLRTLDLLAPRHGHAGTTQERLPIVRNGVRVERPRLWVIDVDDYPSPAQMKG